MKNLKHISKGLKEKKQNLSPTGKEEFRNITKKNITKQFLEKIKIITEDTLQKTRTKTIFTKNKIRKKSKYD